MKISEVCRWRLFSFMPKEFHSPPHRFTSSFFFVSAEICVIAIVIVDIINIIEQTHSSLTLSREDERGKMSRHEKFDACESDSDTAEMTNTRARLSECFVSWVRGYFSSHTTRRQRSDTHELCRKKTSSDGIEWKNIVRWEDNHWGIWNGGER